jgi:hypothetical protein
MNSKSKRNVLLEELNRQNRAANKMAPQPKRNTIATATLLAMLGASAFGSAADIIGTTVTNSVTINGISLPADDIPAPVTNSGLGPITSTQTTDAAATDNTVTNTKSGVVDLDGVSISATSVSGATANASNTVSTSATSTGDATSLTNGNVLTNDGTVTNTSTDPFSAGVGIRSDASSTATSTSLSTNGGTSTTSTATSNATATTELNDLINHHNISAESGVVIRAAAIADASASATAGLLGTATVETNASASVADNTLANSGTISGGSAGVRLLALSDAGESTLGDAGTAASDARSEVSGNALNNSGTTVVLDGPGFELLAKAGNIDGIDSEFAGYDGSPDTSSASISGNTLTNQGTIASAGTLILGLADGIGGADGIRLRAEADGLLATSDVSDNIIENSGRIYADHDGINLSASTSAEFGSGVVSGNTITNYHNGRIVSGNVGVSIGEIGEETAGNSITNSGLIVSDPGMILDGTSLINSTDGVDGNWTLGTAIRVAGSYNSEFGPINELNLNAPGYLAGEILLGTDANVAVNLHSGPSHSVRWEIARAGLDGEGLGQLDQLSPYPWGSSESLTRASLSGSVPWFVNEGSLSVINEGEIADVYATLDPSALAAAPQQLADLTGMTSSLMRNAMARIPQQAQATAAPSAKGGVSAKSPAPTYTQSAMPQSSIWVAGAGGRMNYDGDGRATLDQDTDLYGFAAGYTYDFTPERRMGFMGGYSNSSLQVDSAFSKSYDNSADGGFLGIYGSSQLQEYTLDLSLAGGWLSHDDRRFVNDNLLWLGRSNASSSYDSSWLSPEIRLSRQFAMADGWSSNPSLGVRYSMQNIDGYTENGTNSDAKVASRDLATLETTLELQIAKATSFGGFGFRGGYFYRSNSGDSHVSVTMIEDTRNVSFFANDAGYGFLGADMTFNMTQSAVLNLGVNGVWSGDAAGGNANASVKFLF